APAPEERSASWSHFQHRSVLAEAFIRCCGIRTRTLLDEDTLFPWSLCATVQTSSPASRRATALPSAQCANDLDFIGRLQRHVDGPNQFARNKNSDVRANATQLIDHPKADSRKGRLKVGENLAQAGTGHFDLGRAPGV